MEDALTAYCFGCKEKRELNSPEAVYTANGSPGSRGKCDVCGTTLFRMGATDAHDGLPKPEAATRPKRKKGGRKQSRSRTTRRRRIGKLVIVESPTKARTVRNFLGSGYTVESSVGHIRDLKRGRNAVDVANDFEPSWSIPKKKRDVVKRLSEFADSADEIFLATDPDREGEAIAWHLTEATGMDAGRTHRVVFHEITDHAVREAFANPRDINQERVNAYLARRILDRLVGYDVGSVLKKKVSNQLTAGRVQSVAVRLVVERERKIRDFVPQEYWTIDADLDKENVNGSDAVQRFRARLVRIGAEAIRPEPGSSPASQSEVEPLLDSLGRCHYQVDSVRRGMSMSRPSAPFTTSTLQQTASSRLGMNPANTMRIAQQLYQGIELGEKGTTGLITYMRTDSVNVSRQAQRDARQFIRKSFGKEYLPDKPPVYRTRARSAQEAHEAIRPTLVQLRPDDVSNSLSPEQLRLYRLIWQRFVASQMANASYDTIRVDIGASREEPAQDFLFRASSRTLRFPGFLAVSDDRSAGDRERPDLPKLARGDALQLSQLLPEQHFTQPPPRLTEASLVRALEERGIGRPSTYANIIAKIKQRHYVTREGRHLVPTSIGSTVVDLLLEYFPDVMDYEFTAQMEDKLDEIAGDRLAWRPMLGEFYEPFQRRLEFAREHMPVSPVEQPIGRDCPECGGENTLVTRLGRFGMFIACNRFPECTHRESLGMGIACPQCGVEHGGELAQRRTRNGRTFYSCVRYPNCDFSTWDRPLRQPCPSCGQLLLERGRGRVRCSQCDLEFAEDALEQAEPASS
ncbi:MAG: type I DNA topoisomerase [Anaerolineaceae bacterium]|nr:type I DNA topoisomerase [Anaerolineaceae bacterium]